MPLRRLLLGLVMLGLIAPACAAEFKWAGDGDAGSMDPYTRDETVQLSLLANIYEPLIRRDRDLKLEPALAVRWEPLRATVWRFHLRSGVKWQDGGPFTADDVVFSADRVRRKTSVMRVALQTVKDVRKIDDLTVDFETAGPDPILPQELTDWLIVSKAWCEANGATDVPVLSTGQENYATRHADGTGPFRLVSRDPDQRTVLARNPAWWDMPRHNLDHVEFDVIANAATRVAALLSGKLQMIYAVPPQDADRVAHADGLKLLERPELRTIFLGMDQSRDELLKSTVKTRNPFKDRRVREAMALAIDEDAIARHVMRGHARPTWQMWGPGVNGFDPALDQRPKPDLPRARQLLSEAGFSDRFGVTLDCPNDRYVMDGEICTAITAMLARIGITVDLNAQPKSKYFAETAFPNYHTSLYLLGWTPSTDDALNVINALLVTRRNGNGLVNNGGYSNPRVDQLARRIAIEPDPAKRTAMIRQVTKLVQQDVGYIPLHQQTILWGARSNVELVQMADDTFPLRYVQVR